MKKIMLIAALALMTTNATAAYPNGKRPKLNYKLGNMGTGKCYSDPKANGIYCP